MPAAVFANAVNLEGMAGGQIVIFSPDFLLQMAHLRRKEFDRTATIRAHHVVMTTAVVLMLIAGDSVVKGYLAGQTAFRQQLQGSINGGISDAGIFFLHQAMQFISRKMIARLQKCPQDSIALSGLL